MLYLSQLLGRPLRDRNGTELARIGDLVVLLPPPAAAAAQATRYDDYPRLHGLVARSNRGVGGFFVPLASLATLGSAGARQDRPVNALEAFARRPGELLLGADLADHPVIDCRGAVVRRVNDVLVGALDEAGAITLVAPDRAGNPHSTGAEAAYRAADLVLLGVDVGWAGMLRRLGLLRGVAGILAPFGRRVSARVLPWPDVALAGGPGGAPLEALSTFHPAEIARITDALSYRETAGVIAGLDDETAAGVLQEMDPARATDIMEHISDDRAADIIEEMGPDDASDLLADLPQHRAAELLREMAPAAAEDVHKLLRYPENSAGGMMTTSFITCPRHYTVAQAIDLLRAELDKPDLIYYLYITDGVAQDHLVGVISLRKLLIARPPDRVTAIMRVDFESVAPDEDPRTVARMMAEYNLLALPVLDAEGCLLGIITVDDAIEVLLPSGWQRKLNRIFSP